MCNSITHSSTPYIHLWWGTSHFKPPYPPSPPPPFFPSSIFHDVCLIVGFVFFLLLSIIYVLLLLLLFLPCGLLCFVGATSLGPPSSFSFSLSHLFLIHGSCFPQRRRWPFNEYSCAHRLLRLMTAFLSLLPSRRHET